MLRQLLSCLLLIFLSFAVYAADSSLCNPPSLLSATNINYTHATLSWEVSPSANTYLLHFRPVGAADWIEVPLITNSVIVYLQPCQQYEAEVQTVCEDESSAFSPTILFTTLGCSDPYCFSYGSNTNFEWIESVVLHQINHTSGVNYGYGNFTNLTTELQQGSTYPLALQPGFLDSAYGEYWRIWIDYNKDNDFNDANELVFDAGGVNTTAVTGSITVPSSAPLGMTRMRVAMKWLNEGDGPPLSCEGFAFGETEDYMVNLVASNCTGLSVSISVTPAACGQNNGIINISPSGGQVPYSILWNNGQTIFTRTNLASGTYNFTVTDGNGCNLSQQVALGNIGAPVLTVSSVTVNACNQNNGAVVLSASGGTMPYFYAWSHDAALISNTAIGLAGGNYIITLTDANNCNAQISVTVGNVSGPNLSVSNQTSATCAQSDGFIQLQVSGGTSPYDYNWSHSPTVISNLAFNLPAGSYTCTVTDANGCADIETVNIASISNITLTVQNVQPEGCSLDNGSITVAASTNAVPPLTYSWSHNLLLNSATASSLNTGSYSVTVIDDLGCMAQATASVGVNNNAPSINIVNILPANCGQATGSINVISVMGTGPFAYSWSHNPALNSPLANNLSAGTYTVTVYATNGCFDTHTDIIPNTFAPALDIVAITNDLCGTGIGAATVVGSGTIPPYTYIWSNGQTGASASNLTAGTYTVSVTDATGCITQQSVSISNVVSLTGVNITTQNTTCGLNNGSATASPIGSASPFTYSWSNGITIPNNLPAGTYSLTVTDSNGCSVVTPFTISATPVPIVTVSVTNAACNLNNGSVQASVTNGTLPISYNWSTGGTSPTLSGLSTGTYFITVFDANGCMAISQATVGTPPSPTLTPIEINATTCGNNNGSIWVTSLGGVAPYSYGSPLNSFGFGNNLSSGNYTVSVSDANSCTASLQLTVPQTPLLEATTSSIPSDCNGNDGVVSTNVISGTPPFTYLWVANSTSFTTEETEFTYSNLAAGTYSISVSDAVGCSQLLSAEVGQINGPEVNLPDTIYILPEEQVLIDATTPDATYLWSNGQTTPSITVGLGSYWVAVTVNGCTTTVQVVVTILTSMNPIAHSNWFQIYPNPANNTLFIKPATNIGNGTLFLQLTDIYGRIIATETLLMSHTVTPAEVNLQNYAAGIYLLSLTDNRGNIQVERVVKW